MLKLKKIQIKGIRTKLIASLMGVCLVPLVALGGVNYVESKSILTTKLEKTSTQTLEGVDSSLTGYFIGIEKQVEMTASAAEGTDINNISNILKIVKDSSTDIQNAGYGSVNVQDYVTYPASDLGKDYKYQDRPWYTAAMNNKGKVVITQPYKSNTTGQTTVAVAKTIEKNDKVEGVVYVNIALSAITKIFSDFKIGDSGYVYLTDSDGNMIAHPDSALIGTDAATKQSYWNEVKSSDKGFAKYTYQGVNKFAVYKTNPDTGWKVIASLSDTEVSNDVNVILKVMVIFLAICLILSVIASLVISKEMANNIKKLKEAFSKASKGDLTVNVSISSKDEFEQLAYDFNLMIKNIGELIKSVTGTTKTVLEASSGLAGMSEEVNASISEVASAIEQVSSGATKQAENSQDSSTHMIDLADKITMIEKNSNEINYVSIETKELGSDGLTIVNTLIEKANRTKESTIQVNDIIKDMNENTKQINAISETIAAITEQTNLLSLNASIESARAGEAGKGFAVVAEEIRKLAEESKVSTEEIRVIVTNIQGKSEMAVQAIQNTGTVVNEQDLAVKETEEIFNRILGSIDSMLGKITEIKRSIGDVNNKKDGIVTKIENISAISQETASISEEVTASTEEVSATMDEVTKYAEDLQTLAEKLEKEISQFKYQ